MWRCMILEVETHQTTQARSRYIQIRAGIKPGAEHEYLYYTGINIRVLPLVLSLHECVACVLVRPCACVSVCVCLCVCV